MSRPVITLDIDDTLFAHFGDLADWHNKTYGTNLTLKNNHPRGEEALKEWQASTIEEAVRRVHLFFQTDTFMQAVPFELAVEVIRKLAQEYRLVIITARDIILTEFTHEWLERHFKGLYEEVHFTAQYSLEGKSRTKLEVLKSVSASYIIDDSLENCLAAADSGIKALVFGDYPWNAAAVAHPNITRVKDWQEVEQYFYGSITN